MFLLVKRLLRLTGLSLLIVFQAKRLHELGALFIDVRSKKQWQWGRIEGAYHLDLQERFNELLSGAELDREMPFIIYGNSSYHMRAAIASYLAAVWGYRKVFFYREGYFKWLAVDYPVVLYSDDVNQELMHN